MIIFLFCTCERLKHCMEICVRENLWNMSSVQSCLLQKLLNWIALFPAIWGRFCFNLSMLTPTTHPSSRCFHYHGVGLRHGYLTDHMTLMSPWSVLSLHKDRLEYWGSMFWSEIGPTWIPTGWFYLWQMYQASSMQVLTVLNCSIMWGCGFRCAPAKHYLVESVRSVGTGLS